MAAPPTVTINGKVHDASSVVLTIFGEEWPFKEINYSDELKPGEVEGSGAQLAGRTRGKYKAEGSLTMFKRHAVSLIDKIGDGFMEAEGDIVVVYHNDDGKGVITDTLRSIRFTKNENKISGSDAVEHAFDLFPMYIKWNGKNPLINMEE